MSQIISTFAVSNIIRYGDCVFRSKYATNSLTGSIKAKVNQPC